MQEITKDEILSLQKEKMQLFTEYQSYIKEKIFEKHNIDIGPTDPFTIDDEDPAPGIFALTIQTKQDLEAFKKRVLELLHTKLISDILNKESDECELQFDCRNFNKLPSIRSKITKKYDKLINDIDVIEEKQCYLINKSNQFIQYKDAKLELKNDAYTNLNDQERKSYKIIITEINKNPQFVDKIRRKLQEQYLVPENNNPTSKTKALKNFLDELLQVLNVLRMCFFPFRGDKLQDPDHRTDKHRKHSYTERTR